MFSAVQWAALCAATETNRPHEMLNVIWVIRNRAESGRPQFGITPAVKASGRTYEAVVLSPNQFSAFNGFLSMTPEEIYDSVSKDPKYRPMLPPALACAEFVLSCSNEGAPFSSRTFYYWSPVSMVPQWHPPKWDFSGLRVFAAPPSDPRRFLFAEERRQ